MGLQSARGPGRRALGVSGVRSSRIDSDDDTAHRSSRFAGDDLLSR